MRARHAIAPPAQRGFALIALLALLVAGVLYFVVDRLDTAAMKRQQDEVTAQALVQAKEALIGEAVSPPIESAGYLHLPDIGFGNVGYTEGTAGASFVGNNKDYSVLGKLPWRTLKVPPLRDGQGECLWYMVSGRFKVGNTTALNWDTLGQIDILDSAGNMIATNVVAVVVSPGSPLDGQNRSLADPSYAQCGGNYDARNYLDPFNLADAIGGDVNYFSGSTNNRVALNANNKSVVVAANDHYNDRILFVTSDDLFSKIVGRSDFATQVGNLLDDPNFQVHLQSVLVSVGTGTNNVDCNNTSSTATKTFCKNWQEMLLLKQLNTPGPITIDGVSTPNCARVLFFGGRRTGAQIRTTNLDKANPANYLEGTNASAFVDPLASSVSFVGTGTFTATNPSADLLRCLP